MSSKKQREKLRLRRMEFDRTVAENRKQQPVKTEAKKRGRPKKVTDNDAK